MGWPDCGWGWRSWSNSQPDPLFLSLACFKAAMPSSSRQFCCSQNVAAQSAFHQPRTFRARTPCAATRLLNGMSCAGPVRLRSAPTAVLLDSSAGHVGLFGATPPGGAPLGPQVPFRTATATKPASASWASHRHGSSLMGMGRELGRRVTASPRNPRCVRGLKGNTTLPTRERNLARRRGELRRGYRTRGSWQVAPPYYQSRVGWLWLQA